MPPSRRRRVAERLKNAQNTYAMLSTFNEVDMTNIMEMRKAFKVNPPLEFRYLAMVVWLRHVSSSGGLREGFQAETVGIAGKASPLGMLKVACHGSQRGRSHKGQLSIKAVPP